MCVVAVGFVAPPSETLKFRKLVVLQATARVRVPGNVLMLNGLGYKVEATQCWWQYSHTHCQPVLA
jgi:hypothetical protein